MKHLPVLFGYHASNLGNSHVPLSLCRYRNESGRPTTLTVPSCEESLAAPWLKPAMTGIRKSLVYRLGSSSRPRMMAEEAFFRTEGSASPVYLWAGLWLDLFERFSALGAKIIIERINCHRGSARAILRKAAEFWNTTPTDTISDEQIAEENRKLLLADSVFCPGPMVRKSMLDSGVAKEKLMSSSYGWAPERFASIDQPAPQNPRPVFLFAGTLCLRKGVLLLLEAWKRARIDGELVLCGGIDPAIEPIVSRHLGQYNIRHIADTRTIDQVFGMADVFVFPSLEEGGPMVTYEAMAHAVPPLVTAMGAGAIVEDGVSGVVLPDLDVDAWAAALTEMSEKREKREALGRKARERAAEFTWRKVAVRRAGLLEARYPELWK
ncbi:glycosyltransferase [Chlorobaculum sp. 24CR]|uniref:glycosyltransferase family 4 protein n=1 Tax=Chlorobaculum sp. 24CR TaxID=2508878 RepID=UPI00100AF4BD|nr:glycosyltransferase family 4 protein [Chlorobaculum sp. 24CR]RXK85025.1 glycosyltransferase [Chlorobaculum sp. 24CR]